jgi:antitoxin component YwqK of YwqJK toxin-antitoxin module
MGQMQCTAVKKLGVRCVLKAINDGYCKNHYILPVQEKIEINLPADISNHVLSNYIEYDDLKILESKIDHLYIDPNRTQVKFYEKYIEDLSNEPMTILSSEYATTYGYSSNNKKGNIYYVKETIIDGKLKCKEIYCTSKFIKLKTENFDAEGKFHGVQYSWYTNGKMQYKRYFKHGRIDGLFYEWYPNGNIKFFTNIDTSVGTGFRYIFCVNGTMYYQSFKNNKQMYPEIIIGKRSQIIYNKYTKKMTAIANNEE